MYEAIRLTAVDGLPVFIMPNQITAFRVDPLNDPPKHTNIWVVGSDDTFSVKEHPEQIAERLLLINK
jgi:hypothetical protein